MKFDELMAQQNDGKMPTKDEIQNALKETVQSLTTIKEINDFIVKFSPDDAYMIIRDHVQPKSNLIIRRNKDEEHEEYQKFQQIQRESKETFDYMNSMANKRDVHGISRQIGQEFYGICLRMISKLDDELGKVEAAVNRIEEHIGIDVTVFNEEVNANDTAGIEHEQRIEETP